MKTLLLSLTATTSPLTHSYEVAHIKEESTQVATLLISFPVSFSPVLDKNLYDLCLYPPFALQELCFSSSPHSCPTSILNLQWHYAFAGFHILLLVTLAVWILCSTFSFSSLSSNSPGSFPSVHKGTEVPLSLAFWRVRVGSLSGLALIYLDHSLTYECFSNLPLLQVCSTF